MDARKIDLLLAVHLFKWRREETDSSGIVYRAPDNRCYTPDEIPRFSTTLEGLDMVAEAMAENGWVYVLYVYPRNRSINLYPSERARLPRYKVMFSLDREPWTSIEERANTKSMATAIAALRAIGVDEKLWKG
jgi:hypothetical protein